MKRVRFEDKVEKRQITLDSESSNEDYENFQGDESIDSDSDNNVQFFKKPTNFRFIPLQSEKEFDLLCKRSNNANLKNIDEILRIIRIPDRSDDKIFEEFKGERTITFKISDKKIKTKEKRQRQHLEERKNVRRSAAQIVRKLKPLPHTFQKQLFFKNKRKL